MKLIKIRSRSVPHKIQIPPTVSTPSPERVVLSLHSNGGTAHALVSKGEKVKKGQCIAEAEDSLTRPVFASISGTVSGIRPWQNLQGKEELSIVIQSDGSEEDAGSASSDEIAAREPQRLLAEINKSGIREVDPHPWPLAYRIASPALIGGLLRSPPAPLTRPIETLILNGLDRQPGVFVRGSVLNERHMDLLDAIAVLQKVSSPGRTVLAVSQDQLLSVHFQNKTRQLGVEIVRCPDKYPLGLEPVLTGFITKKEVPQPANDTRMIGAAVVDVITALEIVDSLRGPISPAEIVVQVDGPSEWPIRMVRVSKGTVLEDLLHQFEPLPTKPAKIILGGLLLGYAQHNLLAPLTEEVEAVTIQTRDSLIRSSNEPCLNCGYCVLHCPMGLLPNELGKYLEYGRFEEAENQYLSHCIECGICSYVCPAKRPMVHLVRFGKQEIANMRKVS